MKPSFFILFFLLSSHITFSQNPSFSEINEQVWVPFIEAFNAEDQKALSKVHSKDFIRVIRDSQKIFGYETAFEEQKNSKKAAYPEQKRTLELRFIERIASDKEAFEVGYYKTSYANQKTGEQRTNYGKFHVLLRKENNRWKVMMDADGNLDVDEVTFQSGKKMEELVR
ncbi:MAG: nuclear transport factor 2 family protein [Bacteroidota bacterium]